MGITVDTVVIAKVDQQDTYSSMAKICIQQHEGVCTAVRKSLVSGAGNLAGLAMQECVPHDMASAG